MKILLFAIFLFQSPTIQQSDLQTISKAIAAGDANKLGNFFDQEVALTIDKKESFFSKEAANRKVADFFSGHRPKNFVQVHEGASKEGNARYFIGDLSTTSGDFRVYIYMKISDGKMLIQELRFDL